MNKIVKNILLALLAVVLLLGVFPISSLAEEESEASSEAVEESTEGEKPQTGEDVLFELDERRNMAIAVSYENDPPEISFIAPNGDVYGDEAIADGRMEFYDSGSVLYFRIPDASRGEWRIVYDKKNNDTIDVDCAPYVEAMNIDSFTYEQGEQEDELDTKFTVSYGESDDYFNYIIWAVVTEGNHVVGQTKLREGRARLGEENEFTVGIGSLATYSDYKLMLEVYMESYGAEVFDTFIAEESFSYTNTDSPEAIEDFKVEIGVTDNSIRLDWKDNSVYCNAYIVVIRAEGKDEPVYAAELGSRETSTEVLVDLSVASVTCEIAYKNSRGIISEYATKKIDLEHAKLLTFVCDEVTAATEGKVEYDFTTYGKPIRTVISVNDKVEEALPDGKGSFSIKLDEYENDVKITWFESDTVSYTVSKEVYSDRKAPLLKLYEMTGNVVTEDSTFILTGSTTPGCAVTVGDTEVEVDENGLFTVTLDIADGINEFTVTATSATGNSTKQVISIEKPAPVVDTTDVDGGIAPLLSYLPLILSFLLAAGICVFAFLNSKYYGKKKEEIGKSRAVNKAVRNVFIFIGSIALVCAVYFTVMTIKGSMTLNSSEFLDVAYNSVTKAYELIESRNLWRLLMIIAYGVFGVSLITAIICGIFGSEKHAESATRSKEAKAAKSAAKAKAKAEKAATTTTTTIPVTPTTPTETSDSSLVDMLFGTSQEEQEAPKQEAPKQEEHKFCPQCGAKLPMQAQFCGKCGYKL